MAISIRDLAELVQGRLDGNADLMIHAARPIADALPGDITFFENEKQAHHQASCQASAAVVPENLGIAGLTLIRVPDPLRAFVTVVRRLHGRPELPIHGIDALASVHPTATIAADASIHAFCSVGEGTVIGARCRLHSGVAIGRGCRLGDDVTLHPNVVLYDGAVVGHRVTVHANSVIGADGFGYRLQGGQHAKVPQLGYVELGDDVEIGACTTIDRATFGVTRIGQGTKIDNLVQIAHNCRIGKHNLLVSQVGIAGSSSTGDYVVIAGQVGIADHVHIGDQVIIGAKAGVTKDVAPGQRMLGAPATPLREQQRILMTLEKLPEIRKDILKIKQRLGMKEAS